MPNSCVEFIQSFNVLLSLLTLQQLSLISFAPLERLHVPCLTECCLSYNCD